MKLQGKILKTNADQRLVFGWASVAADESGKAVVDAAGDVIGIDTLEKAAYEFTFHGGECGLMHAITGVAALVESMVFTPEKIQLLNAEGLIPQGWWVGFYVYSDELWEQIKRGQFTMFSIGCLATREEIQQ